MSDVPQNFVTMYKDGVNGHGLAEYWCEVCLDGKEPAAAMFYIRVGPDQKAEDVLRRVGGVLSTQAPHPSAIIIADVLHQGWRDQPSHPSSDPDIPF